MQTQEFRAVEDMPPAGRYLVYRVECSGDALADMRLNPVEDGHVTAEFASLLDALLYLASERQNPRYQYRLVATDTDLAGLEQRQQALREFAATL